MRFLGGEPRSDPCPDFIVLLTSPASADPKAVEAMEAFIKSLVGPDKASQVKKLDWSGGRLGLCKGWNHVLLGDEDVEKVKTCEEVREVWRDGWIEFHSLEEKRK